MANKRRLTNGEIFKKYCNAVKKLGKLQQTVEYVAWFLMAELDKSKMK